MKRIGRMKVASCTCQNKCTVQPPSEDLWQFPKRLGIFQPNFTRLLCVRIYARLRIFIQLPATLTELSHIKHDHPVYIMCAKCPPSAETHAGVFWHFPQTIKRIFSPNFRRLLNVHMYARMQIFIQLSDSNCDEVMHYWVRSPSMRLLSVDGGHFEHIMVVTLNMALLHQSCR